ncbi:MAG TPA: A/G-specific adenine glycosylase [Silvibacterium sp.]|nr:A/G-specific adenine glycosylase [Silvibacterium sp.]
MITILGMSGGPDSRIFRQRLLCWFHANARELPWRRSRDPYAIWVSEIMLQQTRVAAVLEHYARFMERFPALEDLAEASEDEVLAQWSGLGYYRRARMLRKAARFVAQQLNGRFPANAAELRALPGVGEYTSAAIASIGFGEAVACVDGNVERVLRRVKGWDEDAGTAAKVHAEAARLLDAERAGDFNQAMMELGAMVCMPRGPRCGSCPLIELCATRGEHAVSEREQMRSKEATYALVRRESKNREAEVLLERRPKSASLMPGMWELPPIGVAKALDQSAPEKNLGLDPVLTLRHSITNTNYYVTVHALDAKQAKALPKAARRWVLINDLHALPLTGLARKALKRLDAWPVRVGASSSM